MIDDLNTLFVCATKRSGSTYICRWMAQQPDLPYVREWFQAFQINESRRSYGLPQNVPLETLIAEIREKEKEGNWFGIKIMWDNLVGILKKRTDPRYKEASLEELVKAYFPNAKFIWITRGNKAAQAVSLVKALQTGVWEVRPNGPKPKPRDHTLRYSFLGLEEQREIVAEEENQWASFFEEAGIEPLKISYEAFKADPPKYIAHIRELMGLDPAAEAIPPKAEKEVAKTHDATNRIWLEKHASDQAMLESAISPQAALAPPRITGVRPLIEAKKHPEPELNWECEVSFANENPVPYHRRDGASSDDWPRLTAHWREKLTGKVTLTDIQELPQDIPPGLTTSPLILIAPSQPGHYELTLTIEAAAGDTPAFTADIDCNYPKPLDALYKLVGEFENYHGEWICSPWFGFIFVPEYPWIYHDIHGWLECPQEDTDDASDELTFSDAGLGTWTTTRHGYPLIHHKQTGKTLKFLRVDDDQRIFADENGVEINAVKTIASD
jgi:LPS sulfotransferase NodH|tara:strand:+ start:10091 stop:11581 length:1491 start_codon:yes stop_codon:yes gene_type:complete